MSHSRWGGSLSPFDYVCRCLKPLLKMAVMKIKHGRAPWLFSLRAELPRGGGLIHSDYTGCKHAFVRTPVWAGGTRRQSAWAVYWRQLSSWRLYDGVVGIDGVAQSLPSPGFLSARSSVCSVCACVWLCVSSGSRRSTTGLTLFGSSFIFHLNQNYFRTLRGCRINQSAMQP